MAILMVFFKWFLHNVCELSLYGLGKNLYEFLKFFSKNQWPLKNIFFFVSYHGNGRALQNLGMWLETQIQCEDLACFHLFLCIIKAFSLPPSPQERKKTKKTCGSFGMALTGCHWWVRTDWPNWPETLVQQVIRSGKKTLASGKSANRAELSWLPKLRTRHYTKGSVSSYKWHGSKVLRAFDSSFKARKRLLWSRKHWPNALVSMMKRLVWAYLLYILSGTHHSNLEAVLVP